MDRSPSIEQTHIALWRLFDGNIGWNSRETCVGNVFTVEEHFEIFINSVWVLAWLDMNTVFRFQLVNGQAGTLKRYVDSLFLVLDRDEISVAHAPGQLIGDPDAVFALKHWINQGHACGYILFMLIGIVPLGALLDVVIPLKITGLGQQDVGKHGDIGR